MYHVVDTHTHTHTHTQYPKRDLDELLDACEREQEQQGHKGDSYCTPKHEDCDCHVDDIGLPEANETTAVSRLAAMGLSVS